MRVLLDEMVPAGLAALLSGHEVTTVKQAGFAGLDNGELLRRAIASGYEVGWQRQVTVTRVVSRDEGKYRRL